MFEDNTAENQQLTDTVIDLIVTTLGKNRGRIKPTTALLSGRKVFDSYRLMELVLRLEDAFDIRIPDEDLDPDNFATPRAIVRYLRIRLEKDG